MTKKEDLQKQLRELEAKLQPILEKEDRTIEDVKEINALCDQIEAITGYIEAEERGQQTVKDLRRPVGESGNPGQPTNGENRGFDSFGQYLQAVAAATMARGNRVGGFPTGIYDKRLAWMNAEERATGMEESTPSLGGFLVQTDYVNELLAVTEAKAVVYPKTRKLTLTSNANGIKIPGIDETSRASSRWGGILAYWENEGGTITASKPKFRNVELALNKLTGLVYTSDEMLEDSSILESVVRMGFEQEFAFRIDDAILRGGGAGQPLGILNGPCLVSVTGASSASTILAADVIKTYARCWPGSMANSEWFANVDCLPQLMQMTIGNNAIWLPSMQVIGRPSMTLFGKPVNLIEQCSTVGTVGDLILADFSQYLTITKGGLKAASSLHVQFLTDEMVFRFILRIDGEPAWHSALTPYKGSDTQSPFVTVATRS